MPAVLPRPNPVRSALSRIAAASAGVAALLILGLAGPAFAHDELIGSTPSADEQLSTAPTSVVLTYSAAIMHEGSEVVVVDAAGKDWAEGTPVIDTNTLTVPLATGMPEAGYLVEWRVVSSDGHPISGTIPFAVGDATPLQTSQATPQPGADATSVVPFVVGGIVVIVVVVVIVAVAAARRRATPPTRD
ncbi:copper resistance protein CopC [Microbacterium sp. NPDC091382]|uniref:copper resistance CopC family protein n=1 Tax=Microbacterium sp. NPDC091382 TaxID=3364210 RepID=UPI00380D12AD